MSLDGDVDLAPVDCVHDLRSIERSNVHASDPHDLVAPSNDNVFDDPAVRHDEGHPIGTVGVLAKREDLGLDHSREQV
jgi:hypothetical protein